jgi:uncharacterized membrane protein
MNKTRLEAFSDGVFAIIITIMVLELKIPEKSGWDELLHLAPQFTGYVFSFIFLGIYWGNHHHLLHTLPRPVSSAIWANFALLFVLSLIPFSTGWMGETHFEKLPVFVYSLNLLLAAVAYFILQQIIIKTWKHESSLMSALKKQEKKGLLSLGLYVAAVIAALFFPLISAICINIVNVIWIIPDKNIEKAINQQNPAG